jgi:Helix-turn-helix domain
MRVSRAAQSVSGAMQNLLIADEATLRHNSLDGASGPEPFVDANRAAEFLSLRRRRVLELARGGEIPAHPLGNGSRKVWRFRLSELAAAIDARHNITSSRPCSQNEEAA